VEKEKQLGYHPVMLFTITYTGKEPADLGHLLHKHPARPQTAALGFGRVHVFYPETGPSRCTAALLLDMEPPVPGRDGAKSRGIFDYVNDRPYVCSSFMSTAIAAVYGTALSGRCAQKQELADTPLDLQAGLFMLPCRDGAGLPELLFRPLGYTVERILDGEPPKGENSPCVNITIRGKVRLRDLLNHVYVLIPVFDQQKHYWVGESEIDKLLSHGKGWLKDHPAKALIARRYFKNLWVLTRTALDRLEGADPGKKNAAAEQASPARPRLNMLRLGTAAETLKKNGVRTVIELGCGDGNLLRLLMNEKTFTRVTGVDVSPSALKHARKKLKIDQLPEAEKERLSLFQGSLLYRDERFRGYDAALLVEVIEHLDEDRLDTLAAVVFGGARPGIVVISTPNIEYNRIYGRSGFRHRDHRFEWSRERFRFWAERIAGCYGYDVSFEDIGQADPVQGAPTQMGVFVRQNFPPAPRQDQGAGDIGSAGPPPEGSRIPAPGTLLAIEDVLGRRAIRTRLHEDMVIDEEGRAAALEAISRFSADPRWLIYLPPAMSPCKTSSLPEFLEHPREAFAYYRKAGLDRVICEEKHLGARAVIVLCRGPQTALDRFGVAEGPPGIIYTRRGRHFFEAPDAAAEHTILERLGTVLERSGFWEQFATDWVCLDTELFPWPAHAHSLLMEQYAPVGRAGRGGLAAGIAALGQALAARGQGPESTSPPGTPDADIPSAGKQRGRPPFDMNIAAVLERFERRRECLDRYTGSYCRCCGTASSVEDYRIAPFHILATEGKVWNTENHRFHLETIRRFMTETDPLFIPTRHITVDLDDPKAARAAEDWWLGLAGAGGMIVKPLDFIARRGTALIQSALKCREREYLRIIYGPEYTMPERLAPLRNRSLAKKRRLALAEFALGMESLERFVRREPFRRFHECVFAVLALENEAVDPRL
jgi:3' terminal RNA ribose 2'-O-methyltransferase Hen1